jgi:hypothetical protein
MSVPNYRLTRENVNSMPLDSHLFNLGYLGLHTNINRSDPIKENRVFICLTGNGYMIAMTDDRKEVDDSQDTLAVVVGTNVSKEDFSNYAKKYDGVNSPEQIAKSMEALQGFIDNK